MNRFLAFLAALAFTVSPLPAGPVLGFTSHTGSFTDGTPRVIGWDFTTGSTPVSATALSFFDEGQNGLAVAHEVALYKTSTQQQVATATIPAGTAAPLAGFFRTVAITPVPLEPNTTYTIAGSWPGSSDPWVWNGGVAGIDLVGVSTDPNATTGTAPARFLDTTATLQFPTQQIGDNRKWFLGPNVTVSAAGDVDPLVADVAGGFVIGSAQQPDGKTIVIGTFSAVNGVARNNVARLLADGTVDAAFDPSTNARVNAVAVLPDGKIVLGGFFTTLQPNGAPAAIPRNYLARLHADGSLDASFDLQVDSFVYGLAARPDGKLLMWGVFESVLGTTRRKIARLSANGTLDTFDPNPNGDVFGAAVQGDGKVLLGGPFTTLDPNAAGAPVGRRAFARVNDDGTLDMGFDPSPNVRVFATREQADGKVLLSGDFSSLAPNGGASVLRNRIARVNADGTLDMGFNPDAPDFETNSVALQADGKVIFTGGFVTVQGTTRNYVARVDASGTLDAFNPNLNGFALGVTVQDDGKVQLGGGFTALQPNGAPTPTPRSFFARLVNDPATQTLTAPDATQVLWQRGGSTTEVSAVTFEKSLDGGATWTPLGIGTRVGTSANWQLTGQDFNGQVGKVRARGFTAGGYFNGSSGLIGQTGDFNFTPGFTLAPTLTAPATGISTKAPITVTFTLPEEALNGSVKLAFVRSSDPGFTRTLTLAASQEGAGEHTFTFDPANVVASSGGAVASFSHADLPDLIYDVTLSYQDAAGNPVASATNANVRIDTLTQAPALLSTPQTNGTIGGPVQASNVFSSLLFNLPEAALPGSVTFTFDDGTNQYVFATTTAVGASGSNQIVFDPADPVGGSTRGFPLPAGAAAFASGPGSLPVGGPYSVSFTYQDAVGNVAVQSNVVTGVMVDLTTQTPTLTLPAVDALVGNPVTVTFTLPEDAFDSPGVMTLNFGTTSLTLDQSLRTAGEHTFTFDPADPVGTSGGAITNGSEIADGTYTVTLSYRDAVFNPAAMATNTGVRIDTTAPAFNPGFSPTIVYAGTALADYRAQADVSDENGLAAGSPSQLPAPGTVLSEGTQQVTITASDDAGNTSSTSFDLIVRPANATIHDVLAKGAPAPGAGTNGLPADAVLASFGVPATDDDGDLAFIAKWATPGGVKGTGLFSNAACLAVLGGDASAVGGAGATWKSFTDPVVDDGRAVFIATLGGVAKTSAAVIVKQVANSDALEKVAQAGDVAPDGAGAQPAGGAVFKSFKAVTTVNGSVAYLAQVTGGTPRTTAANDMGLWLSVQTLGPLLHVQGLREGQAVAGRTIKTLVAFRPGNGSPGCGRGTFVQPGITAQVCALAMFTDKTQGVVMQDLNVTGATALSLSGDTATGVDNGATFASYGPPARNRAQTTAFLGKLTIANGVTKADASGIFTGPDGSGKFKTVIRVGVSASQAGTGATFKLLKDPVLSEDGGIAFPATVTVKGAGAQTLWWKPASQPLRLLAQGGAQPPDLAAGAQWKSFPSLAIATNRGPIFAATLVPGKGGVTAKTAKGVWACDFVGAPRLLFRAGDTNIVANKTLKSFTLLKATKGSEGVTRSFNGAQQVVWLATFTDKSQAIVTTVVP